MIHQHRLLSGLAFALLFLAVTGMSFGTGSTIYRVRVNSYRGGSWQYTYITRANNGAIIDFEAGTTFDITVYRNSDGTAPFVFGLTPPGLSELTYSCNTCTSQLWSSRSGAGGWSARVDTDTPLNFTMHQTAASCTYDVDSPISVPREGGLAYIGVDTQGDCIWSVSESISWISVLSGLAYQGDGTVELSVTANTGAPRSATMTVAGKTVTVNQAGCTYIVEPHVISVPAAATTEYIDVDSLTGCAWTASESASWISILSGTPGNGDGTVVISISANSGSARSVNVTVAGTAVTVNQNGPDPTYPLTIAVANIPGGSTAVPNIYGRVALFNNSGVLRGEDATDVNGEAAFTELTAGTYSYRVYVNYTPSGMGEEYWGSESVTIPASNPVAFVRKMPYAGVPVLKDATTNEVIDWGGMIATTRQIKVEVPIINPTNGTTSTSYVMVLLDSSRSLPADFESQTDTHSIAAGGQAISSTGTITLDIPGNYYFGAQTKTDLSGTYTVTDTSAFPESLMIQVGSEIYYHLSDVRAQDGGAFSVHVKPITFGDGFDKSSMMTMSDWSRVAAAYVTDLGETSSLPLTEPLNRGWLDLIVDATYPSWFTSYMFDSREFIKGDDLFFAPPIYRPLVLELAYGGLNPFDPVERQDLYTRFVMDAVSGRNIEFPIELQDVQIDTSTIRIEKLDAEVAAGLVSDLAEIAGNITDPEVINFVNGLTSSIGKGYPLSGLLREYGRILQANPELVNGLRIGTDIIEVVGDLAQAGTTVVNEATREIAIRAYLNSSAVARRRLALLSEAYQYCRTHGIPNLDASLGAAISSVTSMIDAERSAWRAGFSALLRQGTVANLLAFGNDIADVIAEISTGRPDACVSGQVLVRIVRALKQNETSPIFQGLSENPGLWGNVVDAAVTFVELLSDISEYYRDYAGALTINTMIDRYDSYLPFHSGEIIDPAVVIKKKDAKFLLSYQAYRLIDLTVDYYAPSTGWEWAMWLKDAGVGLVTAGPTAGFSMVSPVVTGSMMAITQLQNWAYDDILDDARAELQNIMDGYEANRTADRNLRSFLETNYLSGNSGPEIPDVPTAQLRIIPIVKQSVEVGTTVYVQVAIDGLAEGDLASISYSGFVTGTANPIPITPTEADLGTRQITVSATSSESGSDEYTFDVEVISPVLLPEINIKQGSTNIPSDGSHNFGSLDVGEEIETLFTIENLGTGSLNLSGTPVLRIMGTNADQFSVVIQPPSAVLPGTPAYFNIRFAPTSPGLKVAYFAIQNDDYSESWYYINLAGTGVAVDPEINVKQGTTDLPDGANYDFGCRPIGTTTDASFTIENTGEADLLLTLSITGTNADQFVVQQPPQTPVTPGFTTSFVIQFHPTSIGSKTASILISNNDPDEGTYEIILQGCGIDTPKNRIDFNRDGHEDILWRFYGTGGNNRAWFLGEVAQPSIPLSASGSPILDGMTVRDNTSDLRLSHPGNMEIATAAREIKGKKQAQDGLSVMANRRGHALVVDDPRNAGGKSTRGSAVVPDPRRVKVELVANADQDSPLELAAAPTLVGGADLLAVDDMAWQIVGTGDFDKDTHIDILWHNTSSGANVVWFMNQTAWTSSAPVLGVSDLSWEIVGTGDFDQDEQVDILWRNSTSGVNVVWFMNGTEWESSAEILGVTDLSWKIVGTGDFDRDGNIDILWRNLSGGWNVVWYMNGTEWRDSAELIQVTDPAWQIVGTGDYDNNGSADILWRYYGAGGANVIWYMDNASWVESAEILPVQDLNWKIVSR